MAPRKTQDITARLLRLPVDLDARLNAAACKDGRSIADYLRRLLDANLPKIKA